MHFKVLATLVACISCLLTIYFIKSTLNAYKTRSRVDNAEIELQKLKAENTKLQGDIEYRKTEEFVISEAREKLNYSFEDEKIVIVPKSEIEKNKKQENTQEVDGEENINIVTKNTEPVLVQWVKAFL